MKPHVIDTVLYNRALCIKYQRVGRAGAPRGPPRILRPPSVPQKSKKDLVQSELGNDNDSVEQLRWLSAHRTCYEVAHFTRYFNV